jgi:hypothetical protein
VDLIDRSNKKSDRQAFHRKAEFAFYGEWSSGNLANGKNDILLQTSEQNA